LFRGLGQFKHFRVVHVIRSYDHSRLPTAPGRIGKGSERVKAAWDRR
jgi:hypothetical protein